MILIDTDVLVDVATNRPPFSEVSTELLNIIDGGAESACVAWHSLSNLYYVAEPHIGGPDIRLFIHDLTRLATVVPTDNDDVRYALDLLMEDFEDAMQVAAARTGGARVIVTRNMEDYEQSPIRAISPAEAVAELS